MTKEQQAVVARYREQQDVKSKSTHSTKGPELAYSVEQRRALELMAQRDRYDTVWLLAYHFSLNYQTRSFRRFN